MTNNIKLIRPRKKINIFLSFLSGALCIASAGYGWDAYKSNQSVREISDSNEALRRDAITSKTKPSRADIELSRKWENLRSEQAYPWAKVFGAVERMNDPEIELLEFHPNRNEKTVTLKGEGRNAESIVRLLEHLQDDPAFAKVYLLHTAKTEHGRLSTREFEIRANLSNN